MNVQTQSRGDVIGARVADLDTPSLVLDLELLDRNIQRIAGHCRERGVGWRPQSKGMRVQPLVLRCVQAGALGITCAKLGDAEWYVDGGITSVLIANEIIGDAKLERLVALRKRAEVILSV